MGTSDVQDWDMDSIMKRNIRISDYILVILKKWNNGYLSTASKIVVEEPTAEDLARIEEFKQKGWI